jgi:hypothetical protein
MTTQLQVETHALLRPAQVERTVEERETLKKQLQNPAIEDKGPVMTQLRNLEKTFAMQAPKAFQGWEIDAAVKEEKALREKMLDGMPSHEEMRKNPPGAVDKHMAWEKKNKPLLERWKNIKLRLNVGNPAEDIANFEMYRPRQSTLNMDNAQISGSMTFLPPEGAGSAVTFSSAQIELLKQLAPEMANKLALLNKEQRAQIKAILNDAKPAEETKDKEVI